LANKGFRSYSFTIPLRPEIKLGFPLFIPHRDMYGYVKSVNIQFQIGGSATMSITLDALRKRAMFPQEQAMPDGTKGTIFVAQPNLVLKWTKGGSATATSDPGAPEANQIGNQVTIKKPPTNPDVTSDQKALIDFQQQQMGSYYAISSDTKDASWRIQADDEHIWSADNPQSAGSFFREVDNTFYADIRNTIPYTDEKGYEVLAPFPWGRWIDIKSALQEFTRDGYVFRPVTQTSDFKLVQGVNTFLYAGMGMPTGAGDAAPALTAALTALQTSVGVPANTGSPGSTSAVGNLFASKQAGANITTSQGTLTDITVFELDYTGFNPGGADSIIQVGQPDSKIDSALITVSAAAEQQKVSMFLTGTPPQPDPTLASQVKAAGNKALSSEQVPLQPGQFTTQP
jgi:hypothetical protein